MIRLENVKKSYENFELDCTMEVKKGQVTGLIGRKGSGKSTVFRATLNLINITDGEIQVFPEGGYADSENKKKDIGVFINDSGFCMYFTVKKIASVMDSMYEKFNRQIFLDRCIAAGLPLNRKIEKFSTGMKTKLKIIIATSYNAKLLLLDEPATGPDVVAREEIINMLREFIMDGEKSILISSHIAEDIESICDDIYMIDSGRIILHEYTHVILDEYGILKLTEEQFRKTDKEYLFKVKRESYGYICLTREKKFYMENYKDIVIENCSLDMLIKLMSGGEENERSA